MMRDHCVGRQVGMGRRVQFQAESSEQEARLDEEERKRLRSEGEGDGSLKLRQRIKDFMIQFAAQKTMVMAQPTELMTKFIARLSRSYPHPGTLNQYMRALNRSGLHFDGKGGIRDEQDHEIATLQKGIKKRKDRVDRTVHTTRPGVCDHSDLLTALAAEDEDEPRDKMMRQFLLLVVMTGNRPHHVRCASFTFKDGCLVVKWGARKIREECRSLLRYPVGWSVRPWPDLLDWLNSGNIAQTLEALPAPEKAAAALDHWLQRRCEKYGLTKLVSTSGRTLMAQTLMKQVTESKMSKEMYEILMDHTVQTALTKYGAGTPMKD